MSCMIGSSGNIDGAPSVNKKNGALYVEAKQYWTVVQTLLPN